MNVRRVLALLAVVVLSAGCATPPRDEGRQPHRTVPRVDAAPASAGESLARSALSLLGTPYRFGGTTPQGFDCSGLVFYVHGRLGLDVPRTAAAQRRTAKPVSLEALAPGDLVFFRTGGRKVDHVGVYVGDGRFVHAPRRARPVSLERLEDAWYRARLVGAGRFWRP